jgi:hypothetical protein
MVAIQVAVMVIPGVVWTFATPDDSTYLGRTVAWGESDVWDYQKFPARPVRTLRPEGHERHRARVALRIGPANILK